MWMCAAVGAWSMVTFKEYLMESIMKVSMHIPMLIEFIVCTGGNQSELEETRSRDHAYNTDARWHPQNLVTVNRTKKMFKLS